MYSYVHKFLLATLLPLSLVACGGGSSTSGSTAPVAINQAPIAQAGTAQSVLTTQHIGLNGSASKDPENKTISYQWSLTTKPANSKVTLQQANTAKPSFNPDVAGNYVFSLIVNDGRLNSSPSVVTVTAVQPESLSIQLNQAEPLSNTVQLGLSSPTNGAVVTWYTDLKKIGTGEKLSWNSQSVTNGSYLLTANIQLSSTQSIDLKRTVNIKNSVISLSATVSGTSGKITVNTYANSPNGIRQVSSKFNNMAEQVLSTPNACSRLCDSQNNIYQFLIDGNTVVSGDYSMLITATDNQGEIQQTTVKIPISNRPTLTLNAPIDGALIYGSLRFSGTTRSDKAGLVTLKATLNDLPIFQTTASTFNTQYDLTGLNAGVYTLSIQATDSSNVSSIEKRTLIVTSRAALAYTPLSLDTTVGQILNVENQQVLYRGEDQKIRLYNISTGQSVALKNSENIAYANDWQVSQGYTYAVGQGSDCTTNFVCTYQWSPNGILTNLSAQNPWAGSSYQQHPIAHDGFVLWCNDAGGHGGSYTLYDVATNTYTQVVPPSEVNYVGNINYDFARVNGTTQVVYWGKTGGTATNPTYDVYQWSSDNQQSRGLSVQGSRSIYPQTDGLWVAWSQADSSSSTSTSALIVSPLNALAPATLSTNMSQFTLRDGVMAWVENTELKAATVSQTYSLSVQGGSILAVGGGHVIYNKAGKTYSWNSRTGQSDLRLDITPNQALVTGNRLYLEIGNQHTLYQVALD